MNHKYTVIGLAIIIFILIGVIGVSFINPCKNKIEIKKPETLNSISDGEIYNLIFNVTETHLNRKFFDSVYQTTNLSDYKRFIQADSTNLLFYVNEYHDCDDFAIGLYGSFSSNIDWSGLAFGIVCACNLSDDAYHAFNIFITNEHEIYYCEPQTDRVWLMKNDDYWTPYLIIF